MKKLFTLLLIILTSIGFAQNSITFDDPDASWNVASTYPNANPQNPNFVETTTKVYGFMGDTLIGSELWTKIYFTPDSNFISDFTYLGNIKEDNGFVIFMDTLNSTDTIYNFNLQPGDSVAYDFGFGIDYLKVEIIDSIEINGEFYKRFHFEEPNYPPMFLTEVWIEGIGSVHGPLFPRYPGIFSNEIPDSAKLTCYKKDNSIIWNNPYYDNCFISIILSAIELNDENFKIFPSPVKEKLRIEIPNNETGNINISIFDLSGKLLIQKTFNQTGEIEINVTSFEKSFYLLQIEFGKKRYRQKFIKQ